MGEEADEQVAFQFLMRSVAPALMALAGLYQIRKAVVSSHAVCDQLPLTMWERARAALGFVLVLLPIPIFIVQCVLDFTWEIAVQHSLEIIAWLCVFYLQTLELYRFVTVTLVWKIFALAEALFLIEQVYRVLSDGTSVALCAVVLAQYACTVLMAGFAFVRSRGFNPEHKWWANTPKYRLEGYSDATATQTVVTASIDSRQSHDEISVEIEPSSKMLQKPLLAAESSNNLNDPVLSAKGPLSVFVRHFDMIGLDSNFSVSDIWWMSSYCIFTVRVKWDKKNIWEVKRRFSDFQLLRNSLRKGKIQATPRRPASSNKLNQEAKTSEGISTSDTFQVINEIYPTRQGCCYRDQTPALTNMVQNLNQFLQELLSSPETKHDELFRAFCGEGRIACANEKFSDQLCIYDFQLLSVVGKGSYGKVMQARKKDSGKIYAIKVLLKKDLKKQTQITHTQTERHILGAVEHPFICSLRYAFQNRTKL